MLAIAVVWADGTRRARAPRRSAGGVGGSRHRRADVGDTVAVARLFCCRLVVVALEYASYSLLYPQLLSSLMKTLFSAEGRRSVAAIQSLNEMRQTRIARLELNTAPAFLLTANATASANGDYKLVSKPNTAAEDLISAKHDYLGNVRNARCPHVTTVQTTSYLCYHYTQRSSTRRIMNHHAGDERRHEQRTMRS